MTPLRHSTQRGPAFTLLELLCTVAIIAILAALLLPVFERGYGRAKRAVCSNNLKQVGVAMSAWAHDHDDLFPMQVSTNQQGTLEIAQSSSFRSDVSETYRHFQALSNELVMARALVCPADRQRTPAVNFSTLRNDNVSYWINSGAAFGHADSPVAGDRNVRTSGRMEWTFIQFGADDIVEFSAEMHGHRANVLFGDAHVDELDGSSFRAASTSRNSAGIVLSLPQPDTSTHGAGASATTTAANRAVSSAQKPPSDAEVTANPPPKSTGSSNSAISPSSSPNPRSGPGRQMVTDENMIVVTRLDGTITTSSVPRAITNVAAESRGSPPPMEPGNPLLEFIQWLARKSAHGTYWLLFALVVALITFELVRRCERRKAGKDRP